MLKALTYWGFAVTFGLWGVGCSQDSSTGGGTGGKGSGGGASGGSTGSGGSGQPTGSGGASATGGSLGSGGSAGTGAAGGTSASGGRTNVGSGGGGSGGTAVGGTGGNSGVAPTMTGFTCPGGPYPAPMLTGLTPTQLAGVPPLDAFNNSGRAFSGMEGPVWAGDALYVSEIGTSDGVNPPAARILKVAADGTVSVAVADAGTNGLALDVAGNLLGGNHKDGAVTRFLLPDFTTSHLVSLHEGVRFNSPNDLTMRTDGNIYFTDPDYQSPKPRPQAKTRVYRLAPAGTVATVIDEARNEPNGITLAADGKSLYVAGTEGVFKYPLNDDGTAGVGTKFSQSIMGADGMGMDCAGNLYVTSNRSVVVLDPSGATIGTINVNGGQSTTNVAFGGPDHKTLYITAQGNGSMAGVFKVPLNVPGYPY